MTDNPVSDNPVSDNPVSDNPASDGSAPDSSAEVTGRAAVFARLRTAAGLLIAWLLLWQSIEPLIVLTGVAAAVGVTAAARLPAMAGDARVRPLALVRWFVVFWVDLVASSVAIARRALWRPRSLTAAIIEVPVMTRPEATLAVVAADLTLRPGSLVLDFDRDASVFYIHGLPVERDADLRELRDDVTATEQRVVRAFGPAEDLCRMAGQGNDHQEGHHQKGHHQKGHQQEDHQRPYESGESR